MPDLQRAEAAEASLSEEQARVMKLEVTVAEQQQRLELVDEMEKELNHYRWVSGESNSALSSTVCHALVML